MLKKYPLDLTCYLLQKHEPDLELRGLCKLSFEGFARYLMDKDNYAFINEEVKQDEEVSTKRVN